MKQLTPHQQVIATAIELATWPPERAHHHSSFAKVPWYLIDELRDRLVAAGIDWREVRRVNLNDERRIRKNWNPAS